MKKLLAMLLCIVMAMTLCAATTLAESDVTLEVGIGGELGEDSVVLFKTLLEKFEAETGIKVELVESGNDHEAVMKTRMASNNMPDLWSTHGWCVLRYGDYCMDLSDQPWVANLDPAIHAVVSDSEGRVLGCPLTQWTYGIVYDEQVFAELGIDPASLNTWENVMTVCEKLAAAGYTPVTVGCKGSTGPAGYLEMMNVFFSVEDAPYEAREALSDGSFDFTKNTQLLEYFAKMYDNGWFNEDIFTADNDTASRYLGTGEYGFSLWAGTTNITTLNRYFPERSYGFLPTPAASADSSAAITVGEGTSFAVSKDTQHPEEALKLLEFLADPENLYEYATVNGGLPAFTNVEMPDSISLIKYKEGVETAGDSLSYTNFFDREWLPSGMWNAMGETMAVLFSGEGSAIDRVPEAAATLQDAYSSLF